MWLKKLIEYARECGDELPPAGYQPKEVKWFLNLDLEGNFRGFSQVVSETTGSKPQRGKLINLPELIRTSGESPQFLGDKPEYLLGLGQKAGAKKLELSRELHQEAAQQTADPYLEAVAKFLDFIQTHRREIPLPKELKSGDRIVFRVEGQIVAHTEAAKNFWVNYLEKRCEQSGQCLVCGERKTLPTTFSSGIKRVPQGKKTGVQLSSANKPAFNSYGLQRALVSPICQECADLAIRVLNYLLMDEAHHLRIGDSIVYIFWSKDASATLFIDLLRDPTLEDVQRLFRSPITGKAEWAELVSEQAPFYVAGLSGSGGRLVLREWIETTLAQVRRNLIRWFKAQQLIHKDDAQTNTHPLGIKEIVRAITPLGDLQKASPVLTQCLITAALTGKPLPDWILFQAIQRARAERKIDERRAYARAATIKLALVFMPDEEGGSPMEKLERLNEKITHHGYLCGRVLAIVESIQRAALPNINTTIVDRFYGTASTAPASVFGNLIRGAQAHLSKLRKEKPGLAVHLEKRMEEIMAKLVEWPAVLSLRDQAMFALGYYHEKATKAEK